MVIAIVRAHGASWRPFEFTGTSDIGTGDYYNYQPVNYLLTPQKRYNIYAAGRDRQTPWAIVFHPKDSTKKLKGTPDRWHKIEDKKLLDSLIGWMETYQRPPRLMSLLGPEPDRAFFAYIYTPLNQMNTRIEDENTIFVYEPDPMMMPGNI